MKWTLKLMTSGMVNFKQQSFRHRYGTAEVGENLRKEEAENIKA
jgi:hypothetical protein